LHTLEGGANWPSQTGCSPGDHQASLILVDKPHLWSYSMTVRTPVLLLTYFGKGNALSAPFEHRGQPCSASCFLCRFALVVAVSSPNGISASAAQSIGTYLSKVSSALVVTVVRLGYLWKVAAPLSTAVEDAFSSKVHARRGKGLLAEHLIFVKQSLFRIHAATRGALPRISSLNAVELSVCVASLSGSSKGGELGKHKTMIE
jgi:hypothetical protein